MVVDEHLAALCETWQGEHALCIAPRDHPRRADDGFIVDRADEAHLAAAGESNSGAHGGRGSRGQARVSWLGNGGGHALESTSRPKLGSDWGQSRIAWLTPTGSPSPVAIRL